MIAGITQIQTNERTITIPSDTLKKAMELGLTTALDQATEAVGIYRGSGSVVFDENHMDSLRAEVGWLQALESI